MKKKRLIIISVVVLATMVIGTGSALAANDNRGGATLEDKLEAIEERVDEESMTQDEADAIIEQITSCDEDCDVTGECKDRPEEGRGIFGNGANDGIGAGNGAKDGAGKGNGARDGAGFGAGNGQNKGLNGVCDGTCDASAA